MLSKKLIVVTYLFFITSIFAQSWEHMSGPLGGSARRFYEFDSTMYALVDVDVYKFENNMWKSLGLPTGGNFVYCLHVFKSGKILTGTDFGLWYTFKDKSRWEVVNMFMNKPVRDIYVENDSTIILSTDIGIYKTTDQGNSFSLLSTVNNEKVMTVNFDKAGNIWAGTTTGVFIAKYPEMIWKKLSVSEASYNRILIDSKGWVYACCYYQLCRSFDNGLNWATIQGNFNDIRIDEYDRLVAAVGYKLLRIGFKGTEWESPKFNNVLLTSMARNNRTLIGTMGSGVYDLDEINNTYVTMNDGMNAITVRGMEITDNGTIVITTDARIIYFSYDDGKTWKAQKDAWANNIKATKDNTVYVGAEYGITKSNDNGNTWTDLNINVGPYFISGFDVSDDNKIICAGSSYGEVYISFDGGNKFTFLKKISDRFVDAVLIINKTTFMVYCDYLYYTNDAGKTFTKIENDKIWQIRSFAIAKNGYIYLASFGGVFKSVDGKNWTQVNFDKYSYGAYKVVVDDQNNIHLLTGYNDFVSNDDGRTWQNLTGSIQNVSVRSYAISPNGYAWLGSQCYGLYRLKLNIKSNEINSMGKLEVMQNFPNPFNKGTRIIYNVPVSSNVSIKVFDMLGKEVDMIWNAYMEKGEYYIFWYPKNLNSGVYFYTIQASNSSVTKKMIYIK